MRTKEECYELARKYERAGMPFFLMCNDGILHIWIDDDGELSSQPVTEDQWLEMLPPEGAVQ